MPIDAQVIDSTQKAVPADAIVVSVDVPENTTVESNELQVESEDIRQPDTTNELRLLSANEIAVPADSVIVGPDQIAVPADSVVLSPDQIAVSADAEVLEEGQRPFLSRRWTLTLNLRIQLLVIHNPRVIISNHHRFHLRGHRCRCLGYQ